MRQSHVVGLLALAVLAACKQEASSASSGAARAQESQSAGSGKARALTVAYGSEERLPAKVVRLRALDAQATESMYGDLNEELGRMNGEIGALEETLKSFHEVRVTT